MHEALRVAGLGLFFLWVSYLVPPHVLWRAPTCMQRQRPIGKTIGVPFVRTRAPTATPNGLSLTPSVY